MCKLSPVPAVPAAMKNKSLVVSRSSPSGFNHWKEAILKQLIFLTIIYLALHGLLKNSGSYLRPADEYCQNSTSDAICSRPDLFAFQIASGIMLFYAGITGVTAWHVTKRAHTAIPSTPEGRLFGYIEEADRLNAALFVFQVWDFFVSLLIPEHSSPIFLAHHALAAFTAWISLEFQYGHHYAVYFGGCSEFSSIFLVFVDMAKFFPPTPGSPLDLFVFGCQAAFLVTFFAYRVVGWWAVGFQFWSDARYALGKNGVARRYRPGKEWGLLVLLLMSAFLGGLQLYWFGLIVQKAAEVLSG